MRKRWRGWRRNVKSRDEETRCWVLGKSSIECCVLGRRTKKQHTKIFRPCTSARRPAFLPLPSTQHRVFSSRPSGGCRLFFRTLHLALHHLNCVLRLDERLGLPPVTPAFLVVVYGW